MFTRLHELTVLCFENVYMYMPAITFTLFILLSIFLLFSRRMNARAETPVPDRLLPRLNQLLPAGKPALLLEKTDWLFHRKLKLLPDADTGRRLNAFMLLFAAWLAPKLIYSVSQSAALDILASLRDADSQVMHVRTELFSTFLHLMLYAVLSLLPFFLIRKNRELYFDVFALFVLLHMAMSKFVCWSGPGCCPGIPCSWGVYRELWQMTMFPVELLELSVGLLGAALCVLFMLRAKAYRPGRGCSFCLLWYSVSRFLAYYLRYHGEGLRLAVQIFCVAAAVLSIAWLFVLPLEKKLMDRLWKNIAGRFEKLLAARLARR